MRADLRLELVTPDNVRDACAIDLKPGQERFVESVAQSLAEAYAQPDLAWPRLIYDRDALVGFVMGGFDPEVPHFRSTLWRLAIAAGHQGRGYGAFAVLGVAQEARRRGHDVLMTYYVPGEDGPAGFYQRLGFAPTGDLLDGEVQAAASTEQLLRDNRPA
ncbi:GNAT family N-acetyltransferase [Dactylosporangium siamense]|uniref:N-acetyltransferase n=1 Tax=Dactylosporangium siamense TaxID=685454 RepID=A0A919U6R8_9ACTN|nr:GNAT family N-acetyltransferase [Dactylosporangium siamense]GIG43767.1 N-acetyltransferase [Dactylosporangium siamense]